MRSRYSAFALGNAEYLLASWDQSTRPAELELEPDVVWKRLFIETTEAGGPFDETGTVTFTAIARGPDGRVELRERSRFTRAGSDRRWVYVDGDVSDDPSVR